MAIGFEPLQIMVRVGQSIEAFYFEIFWYKT